MGLEFPLTSGYKLCVKRVQAGSQNILILEGKEGMNHDG
jgi:hypothetical protein